STTEDTEDTTEEITTAEDAEDAEEDRRDSTRRREAATSGREDQKTNQIDSRLARFLSPLDLTSRPATQARRVDSSSVSSVVESLRDVLGTHIPLMPTRELEPV